MQVIVALLLFAACSGTLAFSVLGDALSLEMEKPEYEMSAETFPVEMYDATKNCWCNTHWCSCVADTGVDDVVVKIGIAYDEIHCHCSKCFVFVSVTLEKNDNSSQKLEEWKEPVNKVVHLCTTFKGKNFCYSFIVKDEFGCCPKILEGYVTQLEPNHRPIGKFNLPMVERVDTEE